MYAGQIAELGPVREILASPQHPYTGRLLAGFSHVGGPRELGEAIPGSPPHPGEDFPGCRFAPRCHLAFSDCVKGPVPLLVDPHGREARCLLAMLPSTDAASTRRAGSTSPTDTAVARSCARWTASTRQWRRGETLGLVGESGLRQVDAGAPALGLEKPTARSIQFDDGARRIAICARCARRVQLISPRPVPVAQPAPHRRRVRAGRTGLDRPAGWRQRRARRGVTALHDAGLTPADRFWRRYPHELSGGQRQRVAIAAALALEPEALVCDEPVSALDVSVRTQVLRLLVELRSTRALSMLLITHDVGMAWALCDRVAVMYLGRIVEIGTTEQVLGDPQHPYTKALLAVAPKVEQRTSARQLLKGEPPDATAIPSGCRFHPRCPVAFERCPVDDPKLPDSERGAACWLVPGTA